MNDKTKWENAHFEHDAHPVDGIMSKPAAAQEAVAWQVGDDFYTSESLAIEGIQQWGPSGSIAIPLYATPVAAAPGIDLHAPCTEAVYVLARKLLWIAYVWNDHNFDHPYKIAQNLAQEFGIESFDQANAWLDEQAKLIDASPKGGINGRATFQRWAVSQNLSIQRSELHIGMGGDYVDRATSRAWETWQAAMQATSHGAGEQVNEPN